VREAARDLQGGQQNHRRGSLSFQFRFGFTLPVDWPLTSAPTTCDGVTKDPTDISEHNLYRFDAVNDRGQLDGVYISVHYSTTSSLRLTTADRLLVGAGCPLFLYMYCGRARLRCRKNGMPESRGEWM